MLPGMALAFVWQIPVATGLSRMGEAKDSVQPLLSHTLLHAALPPQAVQCLAPAVQPSMGAHLAPGRTYFSIGFTERP